jgi:hypothetical protein
VVGTIVNAKTGAGLADVAVVIAQMGKTVYSTMTDAQGHFLIEDVKEGSYSFRYSKQQYWPSDLDSGNPMLPLTLGRSQTFHVTAGSDPISLKGRMLPLPILKVRVVDSSRKGVPGAQVDLSGPGTELITHSDAEGNSYRTGAVLPGTYTLSAAPPPGFKPPDPEEGSSRVLNWTRTWYPGVPRPELGSKLVVRPGGDDLNIELKLLAVPAQAVSGVLLNPSGNPVSNAVIWAGETNPGPPLQIVKSKFDGTFQFPALPDGHWVLTAYVESANVELRAAQWIDITGSPINDVKLRLATPFTVHGKVVMERSEGRRAFKAPTVFLSPRDGQRLHKVYTMGPRADPDAAGNFDLAGVYPGAYLVHVQGQAPTPFYLDSIRVGEVDATVAEVELSSGTMPITLVYKINGGTVRGTVDNCTSGSVALVPQNPALRQPIFLRRAECDPGGHYGFEAVRPGDYYVVAFAGTGPLLLLEAIEDVGLLAQASTVTVRAGENSQLDLRATARPE